jgi:hypothetical protein
VLDVFTDSRADMLVDEKRQKGKKGKDYTEV